MDHSRQSVLSAHCIGDTHKKHKERAAQTGQIQGSLFTTSPVPNEALLDNLLLISDWVRACPGSKLSLNAASSPLMRKFLSKHIPSGGSIPQKDGLSPYLKDCYKSDKEKLKSSFKNKKVLVFYDETTDSAARNVCVIAISVVPPAGTDIQPHLAIIFEKEHLDQSLVVEHILECSADFSIRLRDVVSYGTDNVGYMLASYKNSLKRDLRNCEIPDSEFSGYRLLCREYSSPSGNEFTLEDLRTEAQSIKDFWDGSGANLPVLSKIGGTYGFLVGSSSCVERIFTYHNNVLFADRASLNSETIKRLMFLYCNSDLS